MKGPVWTRERFENFGWPALGQYRLVVVAQLARRLLGPEIETRLSQPLEARQLEEAFEHLVDVHETTVLVLHERHGWAVVHESMKAVFAFPERPTLLGPLQHRLYRHRQAAPNFAVPGRFDDEVAESRLHGLHGDFFAAGPPDHDHRTVGVPAFDRAHDRQATRAAKLLVCQGEVGDLVF